MLYQSLLYRQIRFLKLKLRTRPYTTGIPKSSWAVSESHGLWNAKSVSSGTGLFVTNLELKSYLQLSGILVCTYVSDVLYFQLENIIIKSAVWFLQSSLLLYVGSYYLFLLFNSLSMNAFHLSIFSSFGENIGWDWWELFMIKAVIFTLSYITYYNIYILYYIIVLYFCFKGDHMY